MKTSFLKFDRQVCLKMNILTTSVFAISVYFNIELICMRDLGGI